MALVEQSVPYVCVSMCPDNNFGTDIVYSETGRPTAND